ncbi:HIT family protein [Cellulomonas chitinilytica]|uniref:HIT family protein n=1 Tax=Cellulomonas chitinilytica TaxID=398759 RepID=A0A919U2N2_9CELL|nr:HIT family protein [Cellulomonas chitinilytica]GIG21279.1 HIT family protein [Cellulomonas chitinilytica]
MACLFCEIVAGRIEASVVHSDDLVIAIMDLHPVSPGHVLVIPRKHSEAITDLPRAEMARVAEVAGTLARAVRGAFPETEGINLLMSEGAAAAQSVFHSHMHVIPRVTGDGMQLSSPARAVSRAELDAASDAVRRGLPGE